MRLSPAGAVWMLEEHRQLRKHLLYCHCLDFLVVLQPALYHIFAIVLLVVTFDSKFHRHFPFKDSFKLTQQGKDTKRRYPVLDEASQSGPKPVSMVSFPESILPDSETTRSPSHPGYRCHPVLRQRARQTDTASEWWNCKRTPDVSCAAVKTV